VSGTTHIITDADVQVIAATALDFDLRTGFQAAVVHLREETLALGAAPVTR
jgi:hypothetical protein